MITEADISKAEVEERLLAQSYLKGLVDFTKWTSTLAIAGVLWVTNAATRMMGVSRALVVGSSILLIISLVLAVWLMKRVLEAWGNEWIRAIEEHSSVLLKKLKALEVGTVTVEKEREQVDRLLSAVDATRRFSRPSGFNTIAACHMAILVIGLIVYVLAEALSIFYP
jgi:hypothetical protein